MLCVIRMTDSDRQDWVNNDEGLYSWWRSSRMPLRKFVRENRQQLTEYITKKLHAKPVR